MSDSVREKPSRYEAAKPMIMLTLRSIIPLVKTAERFAAIRSIFRPSPMKNNKKINPISEKKWLITSDVTSPSPAFPNINPARI